jgi:hypothetical protein
MLAVWVGAMGVVVVVTAVRVVAAVLRVDVCVVVAGWTTTVVTATVTMDEETEGMALLTVS